MGRKIASKPKRKAGCITCRIRKVKCDEGKPSCFRCTSTGRTCDGYQSPFRQDGWHGKLLRPAKEEPPRKVTIGRQLRGSFFSENQVRALAANLSAKPPAKGSMGFEIEALVVLEASVSSPAVRSALLCQDTLCSYLKRHGHITTLKSENRRAFNSCIDLYNRAILDLTGHITQSSYRAIHSALCCCQLFISVDIMQQDYVSSIKHFVAGLKILRACHGRPTIKNGQFEPARYSGLPAIDIFLLKLFTVPCPFARQMSEERYREEQKACTAFDLLLQRDNEHLLDAIGSQTVDLVHKAKDVQSASEANNLVEERDCLITAVQGLDKGLLSVAIRKDSSPVRRLTAGFRLMYFYIITITLSSTLTSWEPSEITEESDSTYLVSLAESLRGLAGILMPDDMTFST